MSKKDDDFLAKVKHQINTTCRPGRVFIGIDGDEITLANDAGGTTPQSMMDCGWNQVWYTDELPDVTVLQQMIACQKWAGRKATPTEVLTYVSSIIPIHNHVRVTDNT